MNKALVFIHGIGLGEWIFQENFVPHYRAQGYEVHTFNLPGHAAQTSEAEKQRITLETCVHFVEQYLTANLAVPYVLVGMSMGGAISQRLLARGSAGRNLRGLVLLSSVPPANNLVFTLRLCRKLALANPQVLVEFFSEKLNPQLMFSPETLSRFTRERTADYLGRILKGFSRLEFEIFFQDVLPATLTPGVPLKVIGGEDDMLFSPEVTRFIAAYYSGQAEILPGLGHMIPIEPNYRHGIQAIDSFLQEVF
jgi:pimeloyl-ACP methyl ester carboxylesterase